jgi:hypothetical protein
MLRRARRSPRRCPRGVPRGQCRERRVDGPPCLRSLLSTRGHDSRQFVDGEPRARAGPTRPPRPTRSAHDRRGAGVRRVPQKRVLKQIGTVRRLHERPVSRLHLAHGAARGAERSRSGDPPVDGGARTAPGSWTGRRPAGCGRRSTARGRSAWVGGGDHRQGPRGSSRSARSGGSTPPSVLRSGRQIRRHEGALRASRREPAPPGSSAATGRRPKPTPTRRPPRAPGRSRRSSRRRSAPRRCPRARRSA